jgi:hypothetical protein
MKKVEFVSSRTRDGLVNRINEAFEKNPKAELAAVVERNKLFTAFIQYDT